MTAGVAGDDAGVALPVCAASIPFAAAPPAGVTTYTMQAVLWCGLTFTFASCDVHLHEVRLRRDLELVAYSMC